MKVILYKLGGGQDSFVSLDTEGLLAFETWKKREEKRPGKKLFNL